MLIVGVSAAISMAQTTGLSPPGGPGADAHWLTAAKNGFGTSNTLNSKVWFTLADGVLTEVYYPTLDVPNVQILQLIVVTSNVETESEMIHRTEVLDPRALTFRQINTSKSGSYTITKTFVTDPQRNTVLIDIQSDSRIPAKVYLYYDPSLNNSGMHDSAWVAGDALLAADNDKASAVISSSGFVTNARPVGHTAIGRAVSREISNGYLGNSDGLTELKTPGRQPRFARYPRADNGNVVQVAALKNLPAAQPSWHCTVALAFGRTAGEALRDARASMTKAFAQVRREYEAGWHRYADRLPSVGAKYQNQFDMAALVLKALEDKTYRGATIASPSIPWGGGPNANEPNISGYHAVWSRDLYEVATALEALGDRSGARRALDYLFNVQQKTDGSFPQNSRVDGRPIAGALQLDEVALPLVLAYQLSRTDRSSWLKHIKPAADFIVVHGPATAQERWEEKPGFSPSTIAAEIAGLVCAAEIARLQEDPLTAERYLTKADDWGLNLERWTATTNGPYGDGHYYLRITENDDPNDGGKIEINSGGGVYDEREIVDAGFLELVRLGIRAPDDPVVVKSLAVVDALIKKETPAGSAWYRYDHDAYGERPDGRAYDGKTGVGRLWTLLSGERGEYELARGNKGLARKHLDTLMGFANEGRMLPEQVWDQPAGRGSIFRVGSGTGSATPLAWSMAQFIRLAVSIQQGRNTETPPIVAARYLQKSRRTK
jgi:glucan 1,4-alpha-glucosidase